jgi:hypothetical protein
MSELRRLARYIAEVQKAEEAAIKQAKEDAEREKFGR